MSDAPSGPTVFNDRYELHRKLARGGMADVYLARDLLLDRPVAVKVLFPDYARDTTFVERFRREAKAAANLNHPNVVAVYDWGEQYGTYFIVMEYVEGRPLSEIIRAEGPLHPVRAAEITADVASALAFAHRNGVVHRDIKPGNILVTSSGQVKVADFGIAQAFAADATQANLTQAGAVMGTATYFSPEQAQGKPVDPRSDLYSLGCVLYEMLITRPPFSGDSPLAIAYKHVQEQPQPLRQVDPGVPVALEAIDLRLLAKDPAQRYPSAEDLRADLRRFIDGRPLAAATPVGAAPTTVVAATTVAGGTGGPPTGETDYVAPDEPPQRRRSAVFTGILIALLVALAAVLLFFALQMNRSSDQVTVPKVTSQAFDQARQALERDGFKVDRIDAVNDSVPAGQVFSQNPPEGSKVDKGSTVTLTVSSGRGTATVPDLKDRTQVAAESALTSAGFKPDPQPQASDKVAIGKVISQDVAAGTTAEKSSVVTFYVSTGPAQAGVPNVSGESVADATKALTDRRLRVNQRQEASSSVAAGEVIRTEPAAGTLVPEGSLVTLIVSSGPASTTTSSSTSTTSTTSTTTTIRPPNQGGGGGGGNGGGNGG